MSFKKWFQKKTLIPLDLSPLAGCSKSEGALMEKRSIAFSAEPRCSQDQEAPTRGSEVVSLEPQSNE